MHPVSYLFEDIYRNDWSFGLGANSSKRRGTDPAYRFVTFVCW